MFFIEEKQKNAAGTLSFRKTRFANMNSNTFAFVFMFENLSFRLRQALIYECRCDERLKAKPEGCTRYCAGTLSRTEVTMIFFFPFNFWDRNTFFSSILRQEHIGECWENIFSMDTQHIPSTLSSKKLPTYVCGRVICKHFWGEGEGEPETERGRESELSVFICNWIKKRRRPRANNVTPKLWRVREADKPL